MLVYTLLPRFVVNDLAQSFGSDFEVAIHGAIVLPNKSIIFGCEEDDSEFDAFYVHNKLGLRYDTVAYRSLSAFPRECYAVLIPSDYNLMLGAMHFSISPAIAAPQPKGDVTLTSLPIDLFFQQELTEFAEKAITVAIEASVRYATFGSHEITVTGRPTATSSKCIRFVVDMSHSTMLTLAPLVTELVEFAVDNVELRMSEVVLGEK